MRLYWWNRVPNLGDRLTWLLLQRWGALAEWAPPKQAEWVGIGSILEHFDGTAVTVWGTGRAGPNSPPTDLSRARVLALRGMETRRLALGTDATVLGDPGLLANELVSHKQEGYTAIVPHWQDRERMMDLYPGARYVDVMGHPVDALNVIAGAADVVSSSLHGIVLADAFQKPRMWDWFDGVQAKGFKFRDYGTVVGKFEPGEWQQPDTDHIKKELKECLTSALESSLTTSSTTSS